MSRHSAVFLVLALGLAVEGCDRCGGVLGCAGNPRLSIGGQLIVHETGATVGGAGLDFVRTGGVQLASDSVSTMTDAEGRFQLAVQASRLGEVVGDLVVRPPAPSPAYRVRGLRLRTSDVRGEGQILGRLVSSPYIAFIGEFLSPADGQPLAGALVTIIRTGGVGVGGSDTVNLTTDATGHFYYGVRTSEPGDMIADLIVYPPGSAQGFRTSDVHITATYLDKEPVLAGVWTIGEYLRYVGVVFHRGSQVRSAGIEVEFQRTAGIPVDPDTFVVQTNADGYFLLSPTPLAQGEVVGNLIVRPPAPEPAETILAQHLRTAGSDQQTLLGVWGYGYGILYGSALHMRGTGAPALPGLTVRFRRTGGIAITPDTVVSRTDDAGMFPLGADASGPGEVIGDLTVSLPAPFKPDTMKGVHITSFASDEMRFLGAWGIGPSLQYAGQLLRADNDAPIANAEVEFQRTGGIAVTPTRLVSRSVASGLFLLNPAPLGVGEVVGNVTIHPPAPFRDTTYTGIRLRTFDNDSLRPVGAFRIAPP